MASETWVMTSRPALIEELFKADPTVLHAGEGNNVAIALHGRKALTQLDEDAHQAQRKILRPFFYGERLERYPELMAGICEEEVASWPMREPIQLLPRFEEIAVRIILSVVYGLRAGPSYEELYTRIRQLIAYGDSNLRMMRFFLAARRGSEPPREFVERRDAVHQQIYRELDRARQDPNLEERDDVLAMLVRARYDDGSPMTDEELRDELIILLLQGHQSTATALSWALERLIRYPDAFERLRTEAVTDGDEYADAVIKETLRMRPPLPETFRLVKKPYRLGGYDIEPGLRIGILNYMVHQRPEFYPEPDRFRPERWFDEPAKSAMWIPFGGGQRYCIGRTFATTVMKVVLRTMAVQTRLLPAEVADEQIKHRRVQFSPGAGTMASLAYRDQSVHADLTPMFATHASRIP
jgi:cytochrome P450